MGADDFGVRSGTGAVQAAIPQPEDLVLRAGSSNVGCLPWQTNPHEAAERLIDAVQAGQPEEVVAMYKNSASREGVIYGIENNMGRSRPSLDELKEEISFVSPNELGYRFGDIEFQRWMCPGMEGVSQDRQLAYQASLVEKLGDARVGAEGGATLGMIYISSSHQEEFDAAIAAHPMSPEARSAFEEVVRDHPPKCLPANFPGDPLGISCPVEG